VGPFDIIAQLSFMLPFLSLILLDVDRSSKASSPAVALALIIPTLLLFAAAAFFSFVLQADRRSGVHPPSHSRRLTFAGILLLLTTVMVSLVCSNIISIVANHHNEVLKGVILYVFIPMATRLRHLHPYLLSAFKQKSKSWYKWYVSTPLGANYLPSTKQYPAIDYHTLTLWVLLYPAMSFVRMCQGQPISVVIPGLDVVRSIMVALAISAVAYIDAIKGEVEYATLVFM
jgi:hypothetical protein